MKALVFAYHEMGAVGLESLLAAGYEVTDVVTHADDPREERWFRSVAELAETRGLRVHRVEDPNTEELLAIVSSCAPDLLFSFYFRKMLEAPLLKLPRLGALNLHGSLLPRYRGRAPVNWVLVNGEIETGVTLHYMDEKPDHGDIVAQRRVAIDRVDTALTLYSKLATAARALLAKSLPLLAEGRADRIRQDHRHSSYFGGRKPEDGRISWEWTAERAYNLVRAVTRPWPGAFTSYRGRKLFVWRGEPLSDTTGAGAGRLVPHGSKIVIQTGEGVFLPEAVQWDGEAEESWGDFVEHRGVSAGDVIG